MQKINDRIQDVLKQHKTKKQYLFVLFLLSAMVIAAVCFSLMTPAVSMSGQLVCGEESHVHGDDCYGELICTENTEGHTHSDECYTTGTTLICGSENGENHEHTDDCYNKELTCGLEETTAHEHTQSCYALTCVKKVHEHSHACFSGDAGIAIVAEIQSADEEAQEEDNLIMAAPNVIQNEYSINDGEENKPYNFENDISKLTINEYGIINPEYFTGVYNEDYSQILIAIRDAKFRLDYTLDGLSNKKVIYCELPDNVIYRDSKTHYTGNLEDKFENSNNELVPIGTYEINLNESREIIITFDDEYVAQKANETITGYIEFVADVKKTEKDNAKKEEVKFGTQTEYVPFADLNVSKAHDANFVYDGEHKDIPYTITINGGQLGTGDGTLYLTDTIHDLEGVGDSITINPDSFKIFIKTGGNAVLLENQPSPVIDDLTYTITLPELKKGEEYIINYTVKVEMAESRGSSNGIHIKNVANVKNETEGLEKTASDNFQKITDITLNKSGKHSILDNTVVWTVTVNNPMKVSLNGYKIEDLMINDSFACSGKENLSDVGTLNGTTFTFDNVNEEKYTFTYETDITSELLQKLESNKQDWEPYRLQNEASLKKGDTPVDSKKATVEIQMFTESGSKTAQNLNASYNDRNVIIPWNVSLSNAPGYFKNGIIIDTMSVKDSSDPFHYMTESQVNEIEIKYSNYWDHDWEEFFTFDSSLYSITANFDDGKCTSFEIQFNSENDTKKLMDKVKNITINYKTTGSKEGMNNVGDKREFVNTAKFNNKDYSDSYTETIKEPFFKWDVRSEGSESTNHKLSEVKVSDQYKLQWCIIANEQGFYTPSDDVVLKDTLPTEGIAFDKNSVKLQIMDDSGKLNDYNNSNNDFICSESNGVISFTIPGSVHKGKKFRIDYEVTLDKNYVTNNTSDAIFKNFANTVSEEGGSNAKTQTQIIEISPKGNLIKVGSKSEDCHGDKTGLIEYSINVNPNGDLLSTDDSGQIKVYDRIDFSHGQYYGNVEKYVTCKPINIRVLRSDGTELEKTRWSVEYDPEYYRQINQWVSEFNCTPLLIFTIPDGENFIIKYTYQCSYNCEPNDAYAQLVWQVSDANAFYSADQIGTMVNNAYIVDQKTEDVGVKIKNQVRMGSFDGNVSPDCEIEDRYFLYKSSKGGANGESRIEKVDSKSFAIKLNGAKFTLSKYENNDWSSIGGELVTAHDANNGDGTVAFNETLSQNTLYRIRETEAPENYVASEEFYYFVYDCDKNEVFKNLPDNIKSTIVVSKVQELKAGENIIIKNTKVIVLPATGSVGSEPIIFIGISIMTSSAIIYFLSKGRKRRTKR